MTDTFSSTRALALVALGVGIGMATIGSGAPPGAATGKRVSLACSVDGPAEGLAPDFATSFCSALAAHLRGDAQVEIVASSADADHTVRVSLAPLGASRADVTITTAPAAGSEPQAVTKLALRSHDSALTAASARTLVLPILKELEKFSPDRR